MLFTDIIQKKRDGKTLTPEDIEFFVAGLADESIPAVQVAALAMAMFLRSMSVEETAALTVAMADSGNTIEWDRDALGGPIIDKHSTGGVGDKVSFLLAPIAAACGCFVPMISGRGLGHTGGTLDKIRSIPGYEATPDLATFKKVVTTVGCAIIGQTGELAPADRRLYAIRDITATIDSVSLITASILSKKIAAGLDGLVMDVKCGSGAFMRTLEDARTLADSIIDTAKKSGLPTHALITDMNEILGHTAGTALEIVESMAFLRGEARESRLEEIVLALSAEMLIVARPQCGFDEARERARDALESGRAAEVFGRMVSALGGPADFVTNDRRYLPAAEVSAPVHTETAGYVSAVDARAVGNAIVELRGGRRRLDDVLDLSTGFSDMAPIGSQVDAHRPLAIVHAASEAEARQAAGLLRRAYSLSDSPHPAGPTVYEHRSPA